MTRVLVDAEIDMSDINTSDLEAELRRRKNDFTRAEVSPEAALQQLRKMDCPKELYLLVEDWANGRLCLTDTMKLAAVRT